ncbi:type II and III secretion system protein family protein [Pollutimonas bauzanensis]|uniref:type II and III secretion system protein family protein n=1 Tax=Pollutimonas bauzanensis TaxID=658167 RepID=UPI00333F7BB0
MHNNIRQLCCIAGLMMAISTQALAQTTPSSTPAAASASVQKISVPVQSQRTLSFSGTASRVAVGNPDVADVKILSDASNRPSAVLLVANKPGQTEVQVWVRGRNTPLRWEVQVIGSVEDALSRRGVSPQADIDAAGAQAIITGQSASLLDHKNASESAKSVAGKGQVTDASTISHSGMVQVEVKVVELKRSVMKDVGIRFGAGGSGPWSAGANLNGPTSLLSNGFSLFYNVTNFSSALGLLENSGMARILAEPTLVAMSGQSASFLAGGEIPVPQAGGLGVQSVVYKSFGIGLTVTPTVLAPNRIALKVAPEASELDYANAIPISNGDQTTLMPALTTRRADTTIELGDGESFVISGLVSRQTMADVSKIPFLGDIPILGSFFRSVRYSQEERELVIIVTPHLVRPIAKGVALPLPGARQEQRNTATNAWGYYLLGPAGGQQMPGFSR